MDSITEILDAMEKRTEFEGIHREAVELTRERDRCIKALRYIVENSDMENPLHKESVDAVAKILRGEA